ncbi:TetR/AcrR family transcriptional regulator [filamentous cyanobacterium LEGE 11480]|uniref:TetR/AcrR family transcriptional regulator n=1 Tax=Romeriopsis navalis LEGE 11480 TaxID=2777977 RepID=A0A928VQ56_9CYAN|nr:TetR/AcrR family transcriptional regulator [Romeriopsis navalis]MBE9032631.1 TetR/AcrR family transcriptional regulator [Romeriopsis navalis LEGE 11480]
MPRKQTITDEAILAAARSLFLEVGAKASTRVLAKTIGISEAVIFQRFGTKEALFFAAMVPPTAQMEQIFSVQPGTQSVVKNLNIISDGIVAYFREIMPVFLALIAHPAFDLPTFLQNHTMPAAQISQRLTEYLRAEAALGRIQPADIPATVEILRSHLHHLAMSETIGAHQTNETKKAIQAAVKLLWQGLAP